MINARRRDRVKINRISPLSDSIIVDGVPLYGLSRFGGRNLPVCKYTLFINILKITGVWSIREFG